jgi:hypothetical protein
MVQNDLAKKCTINFKPLIFVENHYICLLMVAIKQLSI